MKKTAVNSDRPKAVEYMFEYNHQFTIKNKRQPRAYVHSFGCQQNVADGGMLEGLLLEMGYVFEQSPELADLVLFNTCAVRENAENTVLGAVGNLKVAKQNNPDLIIGICGCMTQQKHIADKIKKSYAFVDILFGSGDMEKLPELLAERIKKGSRVYKISLPTKDISENLPVYRENKVKAFVPIMSGCDNFCSYCVVPLVRGRERSRKSSLIINEVEELINDGFKEITLLGQNVNSYGKGTKGELNFSQLLEVLAKISGKFRIRFMTSHPKDCTKELLDIMAKHEKIAKSLHLPVQSGSDRILELMNRKYTASEYLELVTYGKKIMPGIGITSDIIIGFPTETADDFEKTISLIKQVEYSSLFTFAYSPRAGTKAEKMENDLTQEAKTKRFDEILKLQRELTNKYNSQYLNCDVEVLVEEAHKSRKGYILGRTDTNILVIFKGEQSLIGDFVNVKITNYMDWALEGELL